MGIFNSIIVALFFIYWAFKWKKNLIKILLFQETPSIWFSCFIWLYLFWGIINLFY